jgi:hypothetical protein
MTGGQSDLGLSFLADEQAEHEHADMNFDKRPPLLVLTANGQETAAHEARIKAIQEKSGQCLWNDL